MIDPTQFDGARLVATLLDDGLGNRDKWRKHATIEMDAILGLPATVVRYGKSFLRYSKGPRQGFFWDAYGDDFLSPELALLALLQAPVPPFICKREEWERWRAAEQAAENSLER